MENKFLNLLLIAVGVIIVLMLLGAFKQNNGVNGFRRRGGQSQQSIASTSSGCDQVLQMSDYSDCCKNCHNTCAESGLVYNEDCLATRSGKIHPEYCVIEGECTKYVCDPSVCQRQCHNRYGANCEPPVNPDDPIDDSACRNEVVDDSGWNDCTYACDNSTDPSFGFNNCAGGITDQDLCYAQCCSDKTDCTTRYQDGSPTIDWDCRNGNCTKYVDGVADGTTCGNFNSSRNPPTCSYS